MRKKLFYVLSVLLIAMLLPLTVFAEGMIRSVTAFVDQTDYSLTVEVRLSGLKNGPIGLSVGEYRVEVAANAHVQVMCINPAGNVPDSRDNVFNGIYVLQGVTHNPTNAEPVLLEFVIDALSFQDMCPDDLSPVVTSAEWKYVTVSLYEGENLLILEEIDVLWIAP